jgi:hypothetical protein
MRRALTAIFCPNTPSPTKEKEPSPCELGSFWLRI